MGEKKYRFGIMVNRMELYPWQIKVYEELINTGLAECCIVILRDTADSPPRNIYKKISDKNLLFEQYKKRALNNSLYKPTPFPPIGSIPVLKANVIQSGKAYESLEEHDIKTIENLNLDFIFRFGFGILKGKVLDVARWGIWSFHHGDEQEFRGGPPGFWEIYKNASMQGVILQQLTERLDAGKIILKRNYSIVKHSYTENVTKLFQASADMPAQALRMIDSDVLDPVNPTPVKTKAPIYHYPTNFQFGIFLIKIFLKKWKFRFNKLFRQENWVIGYSENDNNYRYIAAPKDGEYYADPFTFKSNNKNYIVAEHYSYEDKKGRIVLINPGSNHIKTVLEKEHHLAYPYIYPEANEIYMMPEEGNSGELNLYKWNSGTEDFSFITTILNKPAIDASILKHKAQYFLFASLKGELPNEKLMIYFSDNLEGPYQAHPCNPVKITPAGARMGGVFINQDGRILRPSQYSVNYYGEKIIFWEIKELSVTNYMEEYHSEMTVPVNAPFKDGIHTIHKNDTFVVIDLKKRRSGMQALKAQL